jgi:hypothetical protein
MKRLLAGTLAAAASLAITASAHAAPKQFYFECTGSTPVQNLDATTFSWSGTAPTASYQSGAGCGWADPLLTNGNRPNTMTDAAFGGTYAGDVRKIDLTLYALDPALGALGKVIDVDVLVDGDTVASFSQLSSDDAGGPAPVPAIAKYNYTLDGLDIPAGKAKSIVLALGAYNEGAAWLQGASEVPSGVKLYAFEDLTCEEQQAYDDTIVCDEG